MNCISCGIEVSPSFKHAFSQNMCPACGGPLIDEESLALIEDVGAALSAEATLRPDTARKLAVAIVARYDIQIRGGSPQVAQRPVAPMPSPQHVAQTPPASVHASPQAAPPSIAQQLLKDQSSEGVISASDLQRISEDGISDAERESIMADVVSKKYGLVDQIAASDIGSTENDLTDGNLLNESSFSGGGAVPILEQERLLRMQKQQSAMSGGGGAFRRSGS